VMKPTGRGRGGVRPGSGRKPGSRNRTYGELIADAKQELATGQRPGATTRAYLEILAQVRCAQNGDGPMPEPPPVRPPPKTNGNLVLPVLHHLAGDARSALDQRLRRIEQNTLDHNKRLDEALETLARVLRHQAAISRHLGAIEPTTIPRHTRRRPLGT
jgi:hypothetical protein